MFSGSEIETTWAGQQVVVCSKGQWRAEMRGGEMAFNYPIVALGVLPLAGPLLGLIGSSVSLPLSAGRRGRLEPPSEGVDIVTTF